MPHASATSEPRPAGILPRALVAADGTLANVLEAYACEQIRVFKLSQTQDSGHAAAGSPDLPVTAGESLLRRSVVLQGATTGVNYVCADALIRADRLPPGVVTEIMESTTPLRRVLADNRIGSFRELVSAEAEAAGSDAGHFEMDPTAAIMRRTYRLVIDEEPVMLISERFPLAGPG